MLPNGITGFRNLKDPYIPEQEKRIFMNYSITALSIMAL